MKLTNQTHKSHKVVIHQVTHNHQDLPTAIDGSCRAMKKFVEKVVEEDYSMLAYSVEEFDLDENENGTIKILYLPSNAGTEQQRSI